MVKVPNGVGSFDEAMKLILKGPTLRVKQGAYSSSLGSA
jgi:hypothetical protein